MSADYVVFSSSSSSFLRYLKISFFLEVAATRATTATVLPTATVVVDASLVKWNALMMVFNM
jgi:hypothetical protein